MRKSPTSEMCQACGGCCKSVPYIPLSREEVEMLQAATGLAFEEFTESRDRGDGCDVERRFLKLQKDGHCMFLEEVDGRYACGVYDARPGPCRSYPSSPSQYRACEDQWKRCLSRGGSKRDAE